MSMEGREKKMDEEEEGRGKKHTKVITPATENNNYTHLTTYSSNPQMNCDIEIIKQKHQQRRQQQHSYYSKDEI